MCKLLPVAVILALASCAPATHTSGGGVSPVPASPGPTAAEEPPMVTDGPTRVFDEGIAEWLRSSRGITLQWIDWARRGTAHVTETNGVWRLHGEQTARDGTGRLLVDGTITEIGADYFVLYGRIRIVDAPDPGRRCDMTKSWRFAITQNRPYFRLREFEWCDRLTDYIDIYF